MKNYKALPLIDKNKEKGFSLIEVLISLGILMLVSTGIFHSLLSNIKLTRNTFYRSQAVQVAQEYLDSLRVENPANLPSSGKTETTINVGERVFNLEVSYCSKENLCGLNTRQIEIDVFYKGVKHFYAETVYTKLK